MQFARLIDLTIRPAVEADVPAVRELLVRTWHDTYDAIYGVEKVIEITGRWHSIDNLTRQLHAPLALFLVAEAGGRLVGTSKATAAAGGDVMLDRLYVDPGMQGSGVGAALLASVEQAYPFAPSLTLEVEPQNGKAVSFYRKQGFMAAGATSDCGGSSGIAANRMRKALRASGGGPAIMLRPVRDGDAQDLIGLITLCFADYPGCFFDPHGDMPDIVRPAQSRLAREGLFLAVEDAAGRVCACAGVDFPEADVGELHRLYVRPDMRGRGLGKLLTARMEGFAQARGAVRMIMWSDTRFATAHGMYAALGYQQGAATRSLGDISLSREFFFEKAL